MEFEDEAPQERAYPYWSGWHVVGCAVLFFGLLGSIGVALLPAGYEKVQNGQLPTGIALMIMGVFGIPILSMSFLSLYGGIRDTIRPPQLRIGATSLWLPPHARGEPPEDEHGLPVKEPPHPEELPLTAIRSVQRSRLPNAGSDKLVIVHDLSKIPLILEQVMMRTTDFDELESVLRAAVPEAFAKELP